MSRQSSRALRLGLAACLAILPVACVGDGVTGAPEDELSGVHASTPAYELPATTAARLMSLVMERVKVERIDPPEASRVYGYTGLAMYEAVVPGMLLHRSLGAQLNGLPALPRATGRVRFDWPSAQAAALARVTRALFADRPASIAALEALRDSLLAARVGAGVTRANIDVSVSFGEAIGDAIITYSTADNFAQSRALPFTPPVGPQFWVPTGGAPPNTPPVEPHWGTLRPFTLSSQDACAPPPPVPYSEEPGSACFAQADAVYQARLTLTSEQRDIAVFWADNAGETATPPGHWIAIVTQLSASHSLAAVSEAYALVGVGVADAFISCWHAKYTYSLLRPETYIQRVIDPTFTPLVPTPQFPEYTSGHSTSSGSASTVLAHLLGEMPFVDRTHDALGLPPRAFDSFAQAAAEASSSRLYGGIHYPQGNAEGLAQGRCIGRRVLDRAVTRRGPSTARIARSVVAR